MTFMDHSDRLIKTVPFILDVSEWTYTHAGGIEEAPYDFLLFRRSGEGYVTTELELFYRFWKVVHGQWRNHASDDPDVRVHVLAEMKSKLRAYLEDMPDTFEDPIDVDAGPMSTSH